MSEMTKFEKKILDFLKGHYHQEFGVGSRSKTETKRISKAKNDIISRVEYSVRGFMLLSELIKISNTTPDRITKTDKNKKYVRQLYSDLSPEIIKATLGFNLVGEEYVRQYFQALQREIAREIFSPNTTKQLFKAIFAFHPRGIVEQDVKGRKTYRNEPDIADTRYRDQHRRYYRDMAAILVEYGIKEIKKNLHPEKDKPLINNLDFTVNMVQKLEYNVDKIKYEDDI